MESLPFIKGASDIRFFKCLAKFKTAVHVQKTVFGRKVNG